MLVWQTYPQVAKPCVRPGNFVESADADFTLGDQVLASIVHRVVLDERAASFLIATRGSDWNTFSKLGVLARVGTCRASALGELNHIERLVLLGGSVVELPGRRRASVKVLERRFVSGRVLGGGRGAGEIVSAAIFMQLP